MPEFKFSASFKVYGSCPACKNRIESVLRSLNGVNSSSWDITTQKVIIDYEYELITIKRIHQAITAIGYNTEDYKTTSEAYNSLPKSCRHFGNSLNLI